MAIPNFSYDKPEGAPESFQDFADWIQGMMGEGAFNFDPQTWDPTQFNARADEAYGGLSDVANQYWDMAQGNDPIAEANAQRQRQINAEYLGRTGVTGSAALNQMNRTEADLNLQNQQFRRDALTGAGGAYANAFGAAAGQAGVNQSGMNMNNTWGQQVVDNNFGMANLLSMFPAFDIGWESTGGGGDDGMSQEEMYQLWLQWQQQNGGGGGGRPTGQNPNENQTGQA